MTADRKFLSGGIFVSGWPSIAANEPTSQHYQILTNAIAVALLSRLSASLSDEKSQYAGLPAYTACIVQHSQLKPLSNTLRKPKLTGAYHPGRETTLRSCLA